MATQIPLSTHEISELLSDAQEMYEIDYSVPDQPVASTMAATAVDPASGALIRISNVNASLAVDDRREDLEHLVTANLPGGEQREVIILSMGGKQHF
jgi:hypothetical protein